MEDGPDRPLQVVLNAMNLDPDLYFPLFGPVFTAAVEGHDDHVTAAYIFALLNYWHVTHCEGLEDNPEKLRRICRQERDDWDQVHPIIFGAFFHLEDGLWHQKRAREEWEKAKKIMAKRSTAGKLGAMARWDRPKGPPPRKQ